MRFTQLLLILIPICVWAQDYSFSYNFVNYNINNGFPSSDVYYGIKDNKGFLWFATDKGVVTYNGMSFNTHTVDENLADNKVISLFQDVYNNIWLCGENSLTKFDISTNQFKPYIYNDKIIKAQIPSIIKTCFVDEDENVYLILKNKGYVKISNEGIVEKLDKTVLFDRKKGFYALNGNIFKLIYWEKERLPSTLFKEFLNLDENKELYTNAEEIVILEGPYTVVKRNYTNKQRDVYQFDSQINSVTLSDYSNTMIISMENGIEKFFPNENKELHYLKGSKINYTLDGNKNGLYVLSRDNGLFIIPSNGVLTLNYGNSKYQKPISQLFSNSQEVFIFQEDLQNPLLFENYTFKNQSTPLNLNQLKNISPDTSQNSFVLQVPGDYSFTNTAARSFFKTYSFTFGSTGIFILTSDEIFQIENKKITRIENIENIIQQANSICFFQNKLWIGTNIGAYSYDLQKKKLDFLEIGNNYHVLGLNSYYDKKLIIGTQNNGIYFYDSKKIQHLHTKNGLNSNLINDIAIQNLKIWLATGNGVAELSEIDDNFKLTDAYSFSDGLNSTDITSIAVYDKEIFAGSKYGLNKINAFLKPKNYLKIYIKNIKINNKNVAISNNIQVPHNASLDIDLMLNSYNSQSPITYYRIKSLNDQFRVTTNLNIVYESLNAGEYTLEYYAKDYIEQTPIHKIEITVLSPWYMRWYVIFPFILLLLYLAYLGIQYYSKKMQSQYQKEEEINRYKLLAFNKQMSSHFISNSFNAINNFILKQDNVGSSRYLSKMSRLFRHSLMATEHNYIPFNQELEAVESYIELEKLRYNNSFEYEIHVDDDVPTNRISITPLILQTLIENAIWHGLLPSKRKDKRLTIKIEKTEFPNLIKVIIEDNGVGINLEELKKQESKGIQLVKSILETNSFTKKINSENIINFVNIKTTGEEKGTICSIMIPMIISV